MHSNYRKNLNKKKGFTVIESLVAIFILLISITGPMAFSQSGLRAAFVSRDQITAFYLAQDALEFIKNWRDNNLLYGNNRPWSYNFGYCGASGCSVDTFSGTYPPDSFGNGGVIKCDGTGDDPGCFNSVPLKINDDGFLGHYGSFNSIFYRQVVIKTITSGEAEVTVTVKWQSHESLGQREIVVKEHIFNLDIFGN